MNDSDYIYLTKTLLKQTKIDLADYKEQQMRRRLDGFIESLGYKSVKEFCVSLSRNPDVLARVKTFLTINVSEFFRDSSLLRPLSTDVVAGAGAQRSILGCLRCGEQGVGRLQICGTILRQVVVDRG